MFDLPTGSLNEMTQYRKFRKHLIKNGFLMMQESIYSKIVLNQTAVKGVINSLNTNKPSSGTVQILTITEKQYNKMIYLVGQKNSTVIDTDERVVVI